MCYNNTKSETAHHKDRKMFTETFRPHTLNVALYTRRTDIKAVQKAHLNSR